MNTQSSLLVRIYSFDKIETLYFITTIDPVRAPKDLLTPSKFLSNSSFDATDLKFDVSLLKDSLGFDP